LVGKRGDLPGELTASLEDYLEAIFHIIEEKQRVRFKDICRAPEGPQSLGDGAAPFSGRKRS
jgi:hypothetical protein